MNEIALFEKLDRIIFLLEDMVKKPSLAKRIVDGLATGAGIMGILSAVEVLRLWIGG